MTRIYANKKLIRPVISVHISNCSAVIYVALSAHNRALLHLQMTALAAFVKGRCKGDPVSEMNRLMAVRAGTAFRGFTVHRPHVVIHMMACLAVINSGFFVVLVVIKNHLGLFRICKGLIGQNGQGFGTQGIQISQDAPCDKAEYERFQRPSPVPFTGLFMVKVRMSTMNLMVMGIL